MNPIRLVKIGAQTHPDGKGVLLTIGTKYAGETVYSITPELMQDLMADLQRLGQGGASPRPAPATDTSQPAGPAANAAKPPSHVAVRAPKRWMLGNGLPKHPMVVLILDPQTDQQAGYAFDAKAAREMAINLVKNADAVAAHTDKQ